MSISAIRPLQGQQAVQSLEPRRRPDKNRSVDRNAGPDTVSFSPEALALSKTARAEATLQTAPADTSPGAGDIASLPRWLLNTPTASAANGPSGLATPAGNVVDITADRSSFNKILRQELIKAISSDPRFAGQAQGAAR